MPKFYCEYCGIYLTNSSPTTRKEHDLGRKHIQSRIDYFSQLLIDAHQEGTLSRLNDIFAREEAMPNLRTDTLKNPYNNTVMNTYDWNSWTIAGLEASKIKYVPIPGMNATLPINPSADDRMIGNLKALIPTHMIQIPNAPAVPAHK